jgi:hypothetical protein
VRKFGSLLHQPTTQVSLEVEWDMDPLRRRRQRVDVLPTC